MVSDRFAKFSEADVKSSEKQEKNFIQLELFREVLASEEEMGLRAARICDKVCARC